MDPSLSLCSGSCRAHTPSCCRGPPVTTHAWPQALHAASLHHCTCTSRAVGTPAPPVHHPSRDIENVSDCALQLLSVQGGRMRSCSFLYCLPQFCTAGLTSAAPGSASRAWMRGLCALSISSMPRSHRTVSWGFEVLGRPCMAAVELRPTSALQQIPFFSLGGPPGDEEKKATQNSDSGRQVHHEPPWPPCVMQGAGESPPINPLGQVAQQELLYPRGWWLVCSSSLHLEHSSLPSTTAPYMRL